MIYLDYQATTPLAPEAAAAMRPWLEEKSANPHSPHRPGREAAAAVEVAREDVLATLLETSVPREQPVPGPPSEYQRHFTWTSAPGSGRIFFTGSATEAINWAIKGTWQRGKVLQGRRRVVTVATEHAAVLDSMRAIERDGAELTILPVTQQGLVDVGAALDALVPGETIFLAMMLINNEIGVRQDQAFATVARAYREAGAFVLCDAVQAFGRTTLPVELCDFIAVSAHKIYGPKGIGALWARRGREPEPLIHGGGQEGGLRSGTLSPALCAGFGAAARLVREQPDNAGFRLEHLHRRLLDRLGGEWQLNGAPAPHLRYPGNINVRRDGVDASRLISELRGLAFSAGSACASGSGRTSHVLEAIGLTPAEARSSIRLGIGRYTTVEEVDAAAAMINEAAERHLGGPA